MSIHTNVSQCEEQIRKLAKDPEIEAAGLGGLVFEFASILEGIKSKHRTPGSGVDTKAIHPAMATREGRQQLQHSLSRLAEVIAELPAEGETGSRLECASELKEGAQEATEAGIERKKEKHQWR